MSKNKSFYCCNRRRNCRYKINNKEYDCPIFLKNKDGSKNVKDYKKKKERRENEIRAKMMGGNEQYIDVDTFDSKGDDISDDEFLEREMFFGRME